MLKPVRMEKVLILATKDSESRLISALHRLGMMEIRSLEIPGLEKGKPLEIYDVISHELIRIRSLINALNALPFEKTISVNIGEPDYIKTLSAAKKINIDSELKSLVDARAKLISEIAELERKKAEISVIGFLPEIDFSKLETRNFTYVIGKVAKKDFAMFKKDLSEYLANKVEIINAPLPKNIELVLIFYQKKEDISFILSRYNFERLQLPEGFSTYKEGIASLDRVIKKKREELATIENELKQLHNRYYPDLIRLETALSMLSERAAIATKFACGRKIVALTGWVKKKDYHLLEAALAKDFFGHVEIRKLKTDGHDAPVVLDNPKTAKPFQWLVEFYSLPTYEEFDPTLILMITFPVIYGMIVGDVGYGLISVILSLLILQKFKEGMLGDVAKIWLFSAISAIVFGFVFDEWFGFTHIHLIEWLKQWGLNFGIDHPLYHGLSRSHNLSLVIGLTLLVGVIHLSLGLILGMLNAWSHDKKHAVAKLAWLFFLLSGSAGVAVFMFNLLPQGFGIPSLGIALLSAIVIGITEGLAGLFEIPGIAANTFSYARIAATGVAGVIIAEIINESLLPTPQSLILLPIFLFLHVLNAALAMFESIVQGGRLNLVEFYSKFFQGGGKAFEPFAMFKRNGKISVNAAMAMRIKEQ